MTKVERARLTALAQSAVAGIQVDRPILLARGERFASKYSPTNLERFRELSEIVWWLAAMGSDGDAIRIADALCEVNDRYYWMFQALGSAFSTRAFLHHRGGEIERSREDAESAWEWLKREPNFRPPTKRELTRTLVYFRDWLTRADAERSHLAAGRVLAHALRVLVIYQQLARCQVPAAMAIPAAEYARLLDKALEKLRSRIEAWMDS